MKSMQTIGWAFTLLAAAELCFSSTVLAATHAKQGTKDVVLTEESILIGQVIDAHGKVVAGKTVTVAYQNKLVASPMTNKNGYFALRGVKPGIYQVSTTKGISYYRVWAKETSPPKAAAGALLVEGKEVIRGQTNYSPLQSRSFSINPYQVGLIAAAIAVPIAIHNSPNKKPASP